MNRSNAKTVAFKTPPKQADPLDAWVGARAKPEPVEDPVIVAIAAVPEPMKRFTIDVSEGLHKRIKMQCAARGAKMADVIRDMLEQEFPAGKGA
jgi:hypothetical protein